MSVPLLNPFSFSFAKIPSNVYRFFAVTSDPSSVLCPLNESQHNPTCGNIESNKISNRISDKIIKNKNHV